MSYNTRQEKSEEQRTEFLRDLYNGKYLREYALFHNANRVLSGAPAFPNFDGPIPIIPKFETSNTESIQTSQPKQN